MLVFCRICLISQFPVVSSGDEESEGQTQEQEEEEISNVSSDKQQHDDSNVSSPLTVDKNFRSQVLGKFDVVIKQQKVLIECMQNLTTVLQSKHQL